MKNYNKEKWNSNIIFLFFLRLPIASVGFLEGPGGRSNTVGGAGRVFTSRLVVSSSLDSCCSPELNLALLVLFL